ncbi:MAG: prolyl-tRNA synthetase associated domain-containing protein [Prevotellaceae bacterium]|jgi:Ala-tRNA(Pro) deacylase|nr:prolyl-tRNA synthetase associated domain-containing protein [Prevotellaceae bacterium]
MIGDKKLYEVLNDLAIGFDYYEHPPAFTVEEAMRRWKDIPSTHCKNLFFRNHKGDRHYLVILEAIQQMNIHDIEIHLKQGKLSFASEQRMMKYLGLTPGSVSPFGLIHDKNNEVIVFIDENLQKAKKLSFHPNLNSASIVISFNNLIKFLNWTGNEHRFIKLYD